MRQEMVSIPHSLDNADTLEEILCLATLISVGELHPESNLGDSLNFFIEKTGSDCSSCPFCEKCLATIINQ